MAGSDLPIFSLWLAAPAGAMIDSFMVNFRFVKQAAEDFGCKFQLHVRRPDR
jgi:hypothetical protein